MSHLLENSFVGESYFFAKGEDLDFSVLGFFPKELSY